MASEQSGGLSGFSVRAVAAVDIDALVELACREVVDRLGVSHAKFLDYQPDEKTLLVRAGVGWSNDVVGKTRLKADLGSPAGYALRTGQPTIANDLARERRFRVPKVLRDHGVRSAVNVIVQHGDMIFGVLEADSRQPREFDERDVQFLQGYGNVLALALAQANLAQLYFEFGRRRQILLAELSHRTKNNHQMLLSLLNLQQRGKDALEVRQALMEFSGRIRILAEIDQLIVAGGFETVVDLGKYISGLADSLLLAQGDRAANVTLTKKVVSIRVDTGTAQSVAIIVNEFLTNSFKHGLQGGGELRLALSRRGSRARLELRDTGPGLPTDMTSGLGLRLIDAMTQELGGRAAWLGGPGTRLRLTFDIAPPAPAAEKSGRDAGAEGVG